MLLTLQKMIAQENMQQFREEGYLVVRDLLVPERDLEPLRKAYINLLDALAYVFLDEANPSAELPLYNGLSFPDRFAILLGSSGGAVLDHIDPVLNIFNNDFQRRKDLPSAQIPEIFYLMRHPNLLDVIEGLIGPEIYASPNYHLNLKLAQKHIELAQDTAMKAKRKDPISGQWHQFNIGRTGWHSDASAGYRDSHESKIVTAWVPMTEATVENSCLLVVPGSHKKGVRYGPLPEAITNKKIPIIASPGDVIFFDNKLIHSASANETADRIRWAFNFRYLPIGEPTGRPFLPGFVACRGCPGVGTGRDARG